MSAPTVTELSEIARRAGTGAEELDEVIGKLEQTMEKVSAELAECRSVASAQRQAYAERIRGHLIQCVESVLAIGDVLIEAKAKLPHGEFEAMVREDLGWTPQTARKFMAIARNEVLANRAHVRDLPPSWGTLSELARVKPAELEQAIAEKRVRPDMTRADTRELVHPGLALQRREEQRHRDEVHREEVRQLLKTKPGEILLEIGYELLEIVDRLESLQLKVRKAIESGAFARRPQRSESSPAARSGNRRTCSSR